jgi:hypothetical protein
VLGEQVALNGMPVRGHEISQIRRKGQLENTLYATDGGVVAKLPE